MIIFMSRLDSRLVLMLHFAVIVGMLVFEALQNSPVVVDDGLVRRSLAAHCPEVDPTVDVDSLQEELIHGVYITLRPASSADDDIASAKRFARAMADAGQRFPHVQLRMLIMDSVMTPLLHNVLSLRHGHWKVLTVDLTASNSTQRCALRGSSIVCPSWISAAALPRAADWVFTSQLGQQEAESFANRVACRRILHALTKAPVSLPPPLHKRMVGILESIAEGHNHIRDSTGEVDEVLSHPGLLPQLHVPIEQRAALLATLLVPVVSAVMGLVKAFVTARRKQKTS